MNNNNDLPLVLIADDEVNTTRMLQHIFEREGYRVESVHTGKEAIEQARATQPDLILLDYMMPGMNGFEVLRILREDPRTASIPTIIVTAAAREPADVARGLKLGANDYLYKPFAPQELLARAQSKIRARQLEEALERRSKELEALLQTSQLLNQHLEMSDLLEIVPQIALEQMTSDAAVVYVLNGNGEIRGEQIALAPEVSRAPVIDPAKLITACAAHPDVIAWMHGDRSAPIQGFDYALGVLLQQSDQRIGVLAIARNGKPYDEAECRLFEGIGRQAALALHNAYLYELQADYAQTLEERVAERTAELESAQKLLLRSEKLASIGHLAASIAHEINNPLMPIRNLIDDIVDELEQQKVAYDRRSVQIIQDSLERIRGIVSRLLEFARDAGPDMRVLDIAAVVDTIVKLNKKNFEHSHIALEVDLPALPPIYGSKDQLEQVFMNLALNAQAAMEGGGKLLIRGYVEKDYVVIDFQDNGCGIPEEHIDRIFDPFYSTKPNGTGLGLFVSHGIIQGHNGSFRVKSRVGKGTTISVLLPIHHEAVNGMYAT